MPRAMLGACFSRVGALAEGMLAMRSWAFSLQFSTVALFVCGLVLVLQYLLEFRDGKLAEKSTFDATVHFSMKITP
jgi:hypothetical protein